jgi:hypothetical protein
MAGGLDIYAKFQGVPTGAYNDGALWLQNCKKISMINF